MSAALETWENRMHPGRAQSTFPASMPLAVLDVSTALAEPA